MDVRLIERLGVTFVYDTTIGVDITFEELQRDFDAVAITAGAMDAVALDIPGADLEGVDYGVDFMKKANLGQPLEVVKTTMAANRQGGMAGAINTVWSRGGVFGCKLLCAAAAASCVLTWP